MTELTKQPIPSNTKCPYCGASPTEDSRVKDMLSDLGYTHDDVFLQCQECDEEWTCGIPIGEHDGKYASSLFCDSCEERYMRVHRVNVKTYDDAVEIHLKCPSCYYFDRITRDVDDGGVALMGYPDITGSTDGADPYGWKDEDKL